MTVKVIVWWPHGGNIGHAAMEVDGGSPPGKMYFSRWPGAAVSVIFGPGDIHKFETDMSDESGQQPSVVTLTKLNETNIKLAMKMADKVNVYGFFGANCAQQVGWCLRQGLATGTLRGLAGGMVDGALDITQSGRAMKEAAIISPWTLYVYAQSLRPFYG